MSSTNSDLTNYIGTVVFGGFAMSVYSAAPPPPVGSTFHKCTSIRWHRKPGLKFCDPLLVYHDIFEAQ